MAQRLYNRTKAGLRRAARKSVHRRVHGIDTRLAGGKDGGPGNAAGVMGVEMDRQAHFLFQRAHQKPRACGLQQPRHIFQPQNMRPRRAQFAPARHIVIQIILRARRIKNIAGVADRAFADLARLHHGIHRHPHVFHPVQAVKHPEHIHANQSRLLDKSLHHIVGIIGVAHPV